MTPEAAGPTPWRGDAGRRIAGRFPLSHTGALSQAKGRSSGLTPANDGGLTATTPPGDPVASVRLGTLQLRQLADQLGDRDWAILHSVAEHRFLSVSQICALHFADLSPTSRLRRTQRVLARLRTVRALGTLARRVGGIQAGSHGLVHYVAAVGERLLRLAAGQPIRQRWHEPSARFARHHLAVADVRIALDAAHRQQLLELVRYQVEPAAWRRYTGLGGALVTLKPDLYAETAATPGNAFVDAWFIEVDLGHEGIPTLLKKCRDYEAYRRQGIEQHDGDDFPWIVWSLHHSDPATADRRRTALREEIDRDRQLDPGQYHVVAPPQLLALLQTGAAR